MSAETQDATRESQREGAGEQAPGVVIVFGGTRPTFVPLAFEEGRVLLGREGTMELLIPDPRVSRRHAEIRVEDDRWRIRDFQSRNGTFVDGQQVVGVLEGARPRVIRIGDTLLIPCDDVRTATPPVVEGGTIIGAELARAMRMVDRAARTSDCLLLRGESGSGKELATQRYHAKGPHAKGRLVAVNCAAIPEGLAERLLFGAKRGAYSGANADAAGHIEMADGGVLFLDEVGELDLEVQSKLLRVLESRTVVALGASSGRAVDIRVCLATHRDLRKLVADGKFRLDLYHRLASPEVILPPLRERIDEIPLHVSHVLESVEGQLPPHAGLVEACMLRVWTGNVRELRKALFQAAAQAHDDGAERVRVEHMKPTAGMPIDEEAAEDRKAKVVAKSKKYVRRTEAPEEAVIRRALEESDGNVAAAARRAGLARTQFYREMERYGISRSEDDDSE